MNLVLLPLRIKQQKSTARMSAFQPKMLEIQKKYAKDKARQQEELMKFQQEYGFSMTAGCMPMILNFLFIFGIIEVVYRPLKYILGVSDAVISQMVEVANSALGQNLLVNDYRVQSTLINLVKGNGEAFSSVLGEDVYKRQGQGFSNRRPAHHGESFADRRCRRGAPPLPATHSVRSQHWRPRRAGRPTPYSRNFRRQICRRREARYIPRSQLSLIHLWW